MCAHQVIVAATRSRRLSFDERKKKMGCFQFQPAFAIHPPTHHTAIACYAGPAIVPPPRGLPQFIPAFPQTNTHTLVLKRLADTNQGENFIYKLTASLTRHYGENERQRWRRKLKKKKKRTTTRPRIH